MMSHQQGGMYLEADTLVRWPKKRLKLEIDEKRLEQMSKHKVAVWNLMGASSLEF